MGTDLNRYAEMLLEAAQGVRRGAPDAVATIEYVAACLRELGGE